MQKKKKKIREKKLHCHTPLVSKVDQILAIIMMTRVMIDYATKTIYYLKAKLSLALALTKSHFSLRAQQT
jgi:hypothetical protein